MQNDKPKAPAVKWSNPFVRPQSTGKAVQVVMLDGRVISCIYCECGEFKDPKGDHLRESAIWRWAYMDEVLEAAGYQPPPEEVRAELKARFDAEVDIDNYDIPKYQREWIASAFMSARRSGKATMSKAMQDAWQPVGEIIINETSRMAIEEALKRAVWGGVHPFPFRR
jgi:hypothetical protein